MMSRENFESTKSGNSPKKFRKLSSYLRKILRRPGLLLAMEIGTDTFPFNEAVIRKANSQFCEIVRQMTYSLLPSPLYHSLPFHAL
jgi:hypothetical protein